MYVLFFPSKADIEFIHANNLAVSIDNRTLDRVTSCKFLGIIIDEGLTFRQHVNYVACKVNSVTSMLYKRRDYLPYNTRRNLYFALIQCRIKYGIEVYGNTTWNILQPLHVANNRALRSLQINALRHQ
jgi:hypothetical protein